MTSKRVVAFLFTAALLFGAGEAALRTNPFTNAPEPASARPASPSPSKPAGLAPPTISTTAILPEVKYARMVAFVGDRLLASDKASNMHVYRRDGERFVHEGSLDLPGEAIAASASRTSAAVSCAWGGLALVDLSTPSSPKVTASWPTDALTRSAVIIGKRVVVADWNKGLHILDLPEKGKPTRAGTLVTPGHACGVAVNGDKAYVADFEGGVHVVDVSNAADPQILDSYPAPAAASLAASGTTLFVADEEQGLLVLDASVPKALRRIGAFPMQGKAHAVSLAGDVLAVSDLAGDVFVLDVSVPAVPTLRGVARSGKSVYSVATDGRTLLYASDTVQAAPLPGRSR